jgi:hypothetical protein
LNVNKCVQRADGALLSTHNRHRETQQTLTRLAVQLNLPCPVNWTELEHHLQPPIAVLVEVCECSILDQ